MRFGWSLALLMMLAGCADDASEDPALAPDPGSSAGRAGEDRQARAAWDTAEQGMPEELPAPIDISWDGAMELQVCAPSGPNSCMGFSQALAAKGDTLLVEAPPAAWNGSLTLTWTASSPVTETLQLGLTFYKMCGSACWESVGTGGVSVSGTSPLELDVGGTAPAASEGLWIWVREERLTPDPVYAIVSPGQDFHVEGRLQPSPTPPA